MSRAVALVRSGLCLLFLALSANAHLGPPVLVGEGTTMVRVATGADGSVHVICDGKRLAGPLRPGERVVPDRTLSLGSRMIGRSFQNEGTNFALGRDGSFFAPLESTPEAMPGPCQAVSALFSPSAFGLAPARGTRL